MSQLLGGFFSLIVNNSCLSITVPPVISSVMDAVCEQLDDTVLQIFQVLEDIYDQQDKLEQTMKDGFLAMSRARYLLGVKWVSVDQILDANFTAKYKTLTDSSLADEQSTLDAVEKSVKASDIGKLTLFELSQNVADMCGDKKTEVAEIKTTDVDKETSLRKRHTDNDGSKLNKPNAEIEKTKQPDGSVHVSKENSKKHKDDDDEERPSKKESSSNSLSLFGILTPQPLRSSQKNFEEGVKIAVSLADLKLKLSLLQCRFKRLSEQKQSLLSDEQ